MKRQSIKTLLFDSHRIIVILSMFFSIYMIADAQINVMTFNIRLDAPSDGINSWANRKADVCKMIKYYSPNLIGLQEVCPNQLNDLKIGLPEYEAFGVGRDDGKDKGEHCPIFYNKKRFKMIKSGNFSLSETPTHFGSKGWDASYNRVCTWAILKDIPMNKQIVFVNTHLDNDGKVARREGIKLILKYINKIAPDMPAIITADFNCTDGEEPFRVLNNNGMKNVRDISPIIYGPSYSWHDFGRLPINGRTLIDHIFVNNRLKCNRYRVIQDKPEKVWLSDHYPVIANIDYIKDTK